MRDVLDADHIVKQIPAGKSQCSFFNQEEDGIKMIDIFFDRTGHTPLIIADIDFDAFDGVRRRYVRPLQVILAEDDRRDIPCLVYNLENSGKTITDVAFVIIDPATR